MLFLVVKSLPKDALIEKQVLYHTGRRYPDIDEDEGGDTALSYPPIYSTGTYESAPVCSLSNKRKVLLI
jgi:diphthine-ammonia ligase